MSWKIDETNCLFITTIGCDCGSGISSTLLFMALFSCALGKEVSIIFYNFILSTKWNNNKPTTKDSILKGHGPCHLHDLPRAPALLLWLPESDGVETLDIKLSKVDSKTPENQHDNWNIPIFNGKIHLQMPGFPLSCFASHWNTSLITTFTILCCRVGIFGRFGFLRTPWPL